MKKVENFIKVDKRVKKMMKTPEKSIQKMAENCIKT